MLSALYSRAFFHWQKFLLGALFIVASFLNLHCGTAVAFSEPTPTPIWTPLPTSTAPATSSPTAMAPTPTETPSPTATASTPTSTATVRSAPLPTALTPTATATLTPTPTSTLTITATLASTLTVRAAHVPILTYHYIRPYPNRAVDPIGYNLSVPSELFEQELDYLQQQGFQTIRLLDLVNYVRTGEPALPLKSVVVTFDDGYADAYTEAFPALKERGMVGTFFIITNFVENKREGYVTWEQVKEMYDAGMEIGAHSLDHVDLTLKSQAVAEQQLAQSQQALEAHLGAKVQLFAYPYGRFNNQIVQMTARYYVAAAATLGGAAHSPGSLYALRRITISGAYNFAGFVEFFNYWWQGPR